MLHVSLVVRCTQRATTMFSIDDIHYVIVNLTSHIKIIRTMKQYTWNVIVIVNGWHETHTEDLNQDEADKLVDELSEMFPDYQYYTERVEYIEKVERHYNENAVDGWEDMYPDRDY